ncbi:Rho family guanine nucleotide exchange factor [Saccharomycopsis crataegensis]|uniref:Rho family guanine nucleotide exchange factor n=1 Tax=Saccharomycopsis crataegensis TaxID=43959 RepID=A0AAV5QNT5_9ASCO|nr:Rho family guanine nucleotide exchange factor [Saccharomycopsis crataegensis]
MSGQNYVQRQETFNDIFGGSRFESSPSREQNPRLPNNGRYHDQNKLDSYNPGVQYENVPVQLLQTNLPADQRQGYSLDPNIKSKRSFPELGGPHMRSQEQQHIFSNQMPTYASNDRQVYPNQQVSQAPQAQVPSLPPSFAGNFPVAGSSYNELPYSPQQQSSQLGPPGRQYQQQTSQQQSSQPESTQRQSLESDDVVAPLNFGRRAVSSGYPISNNNGRSMSQGSINYQEQPRTKSLTNGVYSSFRSQNDGSMSSRNLNGRIIPQKLDLWNNGSQNNIFNTSGNINGQSTDQFGSQTNLNSKSKSINALMRPSRSASSMSSRTPSRSQTSVSSSKAFFGPKRAYIYPAMLSKVAKEFRELLTLGERDKNGLTYRDAFTGQEAINVICLIIRNNDRGLALLLGRALDAQKFFHDVTYEHRLRDSKQEVYQFNEILEGLQSSSRQDSFSSASQATLVGHNGLDYEESVEIPQAKSSVTQAPVEVNGVFTLLTECYSPTCTRENLCYSIACPRRFEQQARLNMKPQGGLKRIESKSSVHGDESSKLLWSYSVPKEILESVEDREKKRQEVIFETIYTERDFVKDLEYIKDFWIIPLKTKNIIPERERESFIRKVFGGINEILMINNKMAEELTARQKQQPVVSQIGDIFINFIPRFHPFVKYAANRIFGKYEFERQKQTNPAFSKFVAETERLKESRRLDLSSFLSKPTSRPARYPLLLGQVLKRTKDDNPDKKNIKKAIEMLEKLLAKINKETGYASDKYQLAILKQQLVFKPGEFVDLKLTDEQRRILYNGNLSRRNNDDIQVYLLDNTLLFVKIKQVNKREQHKVFQRPIPVQLLYVSMTEEPMNLREIVAKETTSHSFALTRTNTNASLLFGNSSTFIAESTAGSSTAVNNANSGTSLPLTDSKNNSSASIIGGRSNTLKIDLSSNNSTLKYPLSFVYIGRRGYDMTLYSQNFQTQRALYEAVEQQQTKLKKLNDIFTLNPLTERFFNHQTNRINCAIPFYGGRRLVCGTDSGIYVSTIRMCVSDNGQSRVVSNPINVIDKPNVTQIEVLDDYQTLIAICDKKLYCWPLDVLESFNAKENSKKGKELLTHVSFFRVGVINGKRLVCAAKNGSSHSIKIFEPIDPRKKIAKKKFKSESKEMPFNSEIVSISFLKSKLCIVGCTRGFQVVSIEQGSMEQLLDPADTSLDFVTRREGLKPIAIYKLNSDYLLSYSEFSFFVDVNGWRSRPTWIIHWEGLPQSFALWYPYLLSFDNNFIEIRDCNTSELLRIITGEGIRLLHASSQEILYAYVDSNGYDVVASLDFWEKANKNSYPAATISEF